MLQHVNIAGRRTVTMAANPSKGFGKPTAAKPSAPKESRRGPSGNNSRQRQSRFIEEEDSDSRDQSAVESRAEATAESEFDRRVSQLAAQAPQWSPQEQQRSAEPLDVLALSPDAARPQPSPAEDDATDGKPSWLVQVCCRRLCSALLCRPDAESLPTLLQAGGATFALLLLAIFALVSVAGGGGGSPPSGGDPPQLSEQQRQELQGQAQRFEEQLAASPDSVEALEGSAVTAAKLGDLKKATPLLLRLTRTKGQDPEVWRLLAETQALQGDAAAATASYETASSRAGGGSIELLSAWTDTLLAAGKPQKAIDVVKAAKQKADSAELAVDLDLLQGRVLSQWRGHNGEALALYDQLAVDHPTDFRPILAKALILKSEGRKADAARYSMKARYLAPASSRQAVEKLLQQ